MGVGKQFERHIRSRIRPDERVKVGDTLAVQTPPERKEALITPISGLVYDCQYFIKERYARQHSGTGISAYGEYIYIQSSREWLWCQL